VLYRSRAQVVGAGIGAVYVVNSICVLRFPAESARRGQQEQGASRKHELAMQNIHVVPSRARRQQILPCCRVAPTAPIEWQKQQRTSESHSKQNALAHGNALDSDIREVDETFQVSTA
jgi:hypothetical protein